MKKLPTQEALISAITRGNRPVSILVGSPMSAPDNQNSPGVPGVKDILKAIEKHISDANLTDEYLEIVNSKDDIERYQESFLFVRDWLSQDDINTIIKNSVLKARVADSLIGNPAELDKDINGWYLPSGTKALGEIVANVEKFSGPILTTNFDPLLSISISKAGGIPVQTVLHTDGKLGQQRALDEKCRSVIHLHGYWHDSDTLHTPDQLVTDRPNLKASLKRLLSEKTLLIVGYGGWDDVFLSALSDLMHDERAELDVLWAFYESDISIINQKYKDLLHKVEAAKTRGRFRMYGGINCHTLFPEILKKFEEPNNKINIKNTEKENIIKIEMKNEDNDFFSIINESIVSKINTLKKWVPRASDAHLKIRAVERELFTDALSKSRTVYLTSDWGMGKEGFIYSLSQSKAAPISLNNCYKINIDDISDREVFFKVAEEQLGTTLPSFAVESAKESDVTLFIDGFSSSTTNEKNEWTTALNEIVEALIDFSPSLKIVISGRQSINNSSIPSVKLEPLDEADVSTYISEHSDGGEELSKGRGLEVLYRLSSGLPISIDILLSELTILSLDELLDSELNNISETSSEPVPVTLERAIKGLVNASDEHQKRSFSLLKVLSVLEFGETFQNVKRFDNSKPLYPSNIRELKDLGLLTTTSIYRDMPALSDIKGTNQEELTKIHTIQPLVRERILKLTNPEEIKSIIERATDITFGEKWRKGQIKLNLSATQNLENTAKYGSGNPHLLASQMLKYAVEIADEIEIKRAFNIGFNYCKLLEKYSRYRDVVNSSKELISIVRDAEEIINFPELLITHGRAIRMQGQHEEAIDVLQDALKYENLSKTLSCSANLSLALAYQSIGEDLSAIEKATTVIGLSRKNSAEYRHASSIILELKKGENQESELLALEKVARKSRNIIVANNLALSIASSKSKSITARIKIYDRVIAETSDNYNQMRAAIRKGQCLFDTNSINNLTYQENKLLAQAYEYGFSQRLNSFFSSSMKILWKKFEEEENTQKLIQLFRYSSLLWRLEGKVYSEKEYAEKLTSYLNIEPKKNRNNIESPLKRYVILRLRFLSPTTRKQRKN